MDCNIFIIEFYNKEGDKKTPSPHEWGVRGVESVADTFLLKVYTCGGENGFQKLK